MMIEWHDKLFPFQQFQVLAKFEQLLYLKFPQIALCLELTQKLNGNEVLFIRTIILLAVSIFVGVVTTYVVIGPIEYVSSVKVGSWHAWQNLGTNRANRYVASKFVRSGQVPLGSNEGIVFFADSDSSGEPLDSNCSYLVHGRTPLAHLWTFSVYDLNDRLKKSQLNRYHISSNWIVRSPDGSFEITTSDKARPGNWFPIKKNGKFKLALRLYVTSASTDNNLSKYEMPKIDKVECS